MQAAQYSPLQVVCTGAILRAVCPAREMPSALSCQILAQKQKPAMAFVKHVHQAQHWEASNPSVSVPAAHRLWQANILAEIHTQRGDKLAGLGDEQGQLLQDSHVLA